MLSPEEVKHIARLARIGMEEDETEKYRQDLSAVLDFFATLQSVDMGDVPAAGLVPGLSNAVRSDVARVIDSMDREALLALFPHREGDHLKVKSVF